MYSLIKITNQNILFYLQNVQMLNENSKLCGLHSDFYLISNSDI